MGASDESGILTSHLIRRLEMESLSYRADPSYYAVSLSLAISLCLYEEMSNPLPTMSGHLSRSKLSYDNGLAEYLLRWRRFAVMDERSLSMSDFRKEDREEAEFTQ